MEEYHTDRVLLERAFQSITQLSSKKGKKKAPTSGSQGTSAAAEFNWSDYEVKDGPSVFTTFSHVRRLVSSIQCLALKKGQNVSDFLSDGEPSNNSDSAGSETGKNKETFEIPRTVIFAVQSIFDLIKESWAVQPVLCGKVLSALLDILQNQDPESLQNEPANIVEPLFKLLLDLSCNICTEKEASSSSGNLSSLATSCLLSLVIAWASTPKLLTAITALLTKCHELSSQEIRVPKILLTLQRSVQKISSGVSFASPEFLNHGIPSTSLIASFKIDIASDVKQAPLNVHSVASDGKYLYVNASEGLYKIGSGFGESVAGRIYTHRQKIVNGDLRGQLLFIDNDLCLTRRDSQEIVVIDRNTLRPRSKSIADLDPNYVSLFSDGNRIGGLWRTREDDDYVARLQNLNDEQQAAEEFQLQLTLQGVYSCGASATEAESSLRTVYSHFDNKISSVVAGKDFVLLTTASGKVLFQGKASSLGLKGALCEAVEAGNEEMSSEKTWKELPLPKGPRIVQCAVGHEGHHAVLVDREGTAFFAGLARRGEDGDLGKSRRQSQPSRPKKFLSMEGCHVVSAACNSGTSALVTKDGALYMFGVNTPSCDSKTSRVSGLQGVEVAHVALGKAHGVVLTKQGLVYTFGVNIKGQCGRDNPLAASTPLMEHAAPPDFAEAAAAPVVDAEGDTESEDYPDNAPEAHLCPSGEHRWRLDQCMVCSICGQCTGYGAECLNSGNPGRGPGSVCGCGSGDSGCSACGACRSCAEEPNQAPIAIPVPAGVQIPFDGASVRANGKVLLSRGRLMRPPMNAFNNAGLPEVDIRAREVLPVEALVGAAFQKEMGEVDRRQRHRYRRGESAEARLAARAKQLARYWKGYKEEQRPKEVPVNDGEREASKTGLLPLGKVALPISTVITQIACGLHHTLMLSADGEVWAFGSNSHGQLGVGDVSLRGSPTLVKTPANVRITMVAAGSHHSVMLTAGGEVLTCGSFQKGQLGREAEAGLWHALPKPIARVGTQYGRKATWIGASGDQTFLRVDEYLVNEKQLQQSAVLATGQSFVILPATSGASFRSLVISKTGGQCRSFSGVDQMEFHDSVVTWDPVYGIIWGVHKNSLLVRGCNVLANCTSQSSMRESLLPLLGSPEIPDIFRPAVTLPEGPKATVTRTHVALHLLCCLETLVRGAQLKIPSGDQEEKHKALTKRVYSKEDFALVNRFEGFGGGWGYSGHSVEAIRFMVDTDVLLGGFGLFGGRGEYMGKIKLFDLGTSGGDQEPDGELLAESEEVMYECGARQKYPLFFPEPVALQAYRWYLAWARVNGPSSDCGSNGHINVTTEDQVVFSFKSSKKSNNGTDAHAGQIPQIFYRVISPEYSSTSETSGKTDQIQLVGPNFVRTVKAECFTALLSLLEWAWSSLVDCGIDLKETAASVEELVECARLSFVCKTSFRILKFHMLEVYPVKGKPSVAESRELAEAAADVRATIRTILSDPVASRLLHRNDLPKEFLEMLEQVLEEAHETFVCCFHVFYPNPCLMWTTLCDLLDQTNKVDCDVSALLAAVLDALCSPHIKLRSILPNVGEGGEVISKLSSQQYTSSESDQTPTTSPSDNSTSSPVLQQNEAAAYPLLVEHMLCRSQMEGLRLVERPFRIILDKLLYIAALPVKQTLDGQVTTLPAPLVRHACRMMSRVVAELALQAACSEDLDLAGVYTQYVTPTRFLVCQNRSWNTGNGSPDAICFSVDRPNIMICGAVVFGGGGTYNYVLELLEQGKSSGSSANAVSCECLAEVHGTYGPDDCVNDLAEIKFDRPVAIKEHVKYALRLRNQGGKTHNGDGGVTTVTGPDGTVFTYSSCALSFNGTNNIRGQLPSILYYSLPVSAEVQQNKVSTIEAQARQNVLSIAAAVVHCSAELLSSARTLPPAHTLPILASSDVIHSLLPHIVASIAPVAKTDPKSAVLVLGLVQEILPHVSALSTADVLRKDLGETTEAATETTSRHVAWVESEHPYRPASVTHYRVCFPRTVGWLCLEFDPSCATAQNEDILQLYIPSTLDSSSGSQKSYCPVLQKYYGDSNWPTTAVILPGNEVIFSLETASEYVRNEKASSWGFRCLVTGYEWPGATSGIRHLEKELSYLGGMCVASLMKKDLVLSSAIGDESDGDTELLEEKANKIFASHAGLLAKGMALSHLPTIQEALDGTLPYSTSGKERQFLRDFVQAAAGTSGGRLARWLQPESVVDPSRCLLIFPGVFSASVANLTAGFNALLDGIPNAEETSDPAKTTIVSEGLLAGWPTILTLLTRDQYGNLVHVPNLKVEMKAVPSDLSPKTWTVRPSVCQETFGGHPSPVLDVRYEMTVKDKTRYHAISFMKDYENYSFEELRVMSPAVRRSSETMLVRANADGTYSANWTPSAPGSYTIHVAIDGYPLSDTYKAEVKEPPEGIQPPVSQLSSRDTPTTKKRMLQFRTRSSAGLRIRAQPSLQAEQLGVIAYEGIISYDEELHNDDGVWVRLSSESTQQWCNGHFPEAWCLQHNLHFGKTLLFPMQETPETVEPPETNTRRTAAKISRASPESSAKRPSSCRGRSGLYYVIKCGASGHNIRAKPYLKAPSVGKLNLGDQVNIAESYATGEGLWVKLSCASMKQYCFHTENEAWSLAANRGDIVYLQHEDDYLKDKDQMTAFGSPVAPFDFSQSADKTADITIFSSPDQRGFVFGPEKGAVPKTQRKGPVEADPEPVAPLQAASLESSGEDQLGGSCGPLAAAAAGRISALQKWLKREERPAAPVKEHKEVTATRSVPPELQGVSVKDLVRVIGESRANGNGRTPPTSPLAPRRNTRSSSAIATDMGIADAMQRSRSLSPAVSAASGNKKQQPLVREKRSVSQTGTQTSPEETKTQFNIGTSIQRPDVSRISPRVSPKLGRKERSGRSLRSRRAQTPPTRLAPQEPVRQGMSPSTAECLRAVFAACLWHSGTVHDAMACASFLKFHPNLPKQLGTVVMRPEKEPRDRLTKEEKARQRHSVEVSSSSYLAAQFSSALPTALEESWSSEKAESTSSPQPKPVPLLPPALRLLVETWEKLTEFSIQAIKNSSTAGTSSNCQDFSPSSESKEKDKDKDKEREREKKRKLGRVNVRNGEIVCELCATSVPVPIVVHLKDSHPGCHKPSRGMGYNAEGQYCGVGIGSCGDTSPNGTSFYFMCDPCRRLHTSSRAQGQNSESKKEDKPKKMKKRNSSNAVLGKSVPGPVKEMHLTMKENATFLLHLSSAAGDVISGPEKRKRSLLQQSSLASVSELPQPLKRISNVQGSSFPPQQFQCLAALRSATQQNPASSDSSLNETETDNSFEEVFQQAGSPPQTDANERPFHRSVSMVTQPLADHLRNTQDGASPSENTLNRRRTASGEPAGLDGGLSFLCSPSKALQKLVADMSPNEAGSPTSLPVLRFVTQRHDLQALQCSLERSIRKAACRVYAMQAMTWLLRSVTQPVCLHDLLWWLVASLAPTPQSTEATTPCREKEHLVGEHPVSDVSLAGSGIIPLSTAFHGLLQTVADLMQHLPMGSPLLQMAIRCWDVRFKPSDHAFLHRSHVFSNISRILSRCEDEAQIEIDLPRDAGKENVPFVELLSDVTASARVEVSSRSGMATSLTDGSTETFWESGDEDVGRLITIFFKENSPPPQIVSVHIDNGRDLMNKVTRVKFTAGPQLFAMKTIETVEVDKRYAGWIHCYVQGVNASAIQVEFRGPENKVRVRQIRLLGLTGDTVRTFCTTAIHQRICEAETLRVFRLLTSQVFGRLVSYEEGPQQPVAAETAAASAEVDVEELDRNEDNDLKEHMVGILFSGKKLSHLQRQVCSHIVQGIRSETQRLRQEWEVSLAATPTGSEATNSRISDSFCFELLSQVLALSGSRVGRMYIAQQLTLPADLLSLLHTGTPRIQRQVTLLLRRVLPELTPDMFASLVGVSSLPAVDYGILESGESQTPTDKIGILDVFLACICKALSVQVKTKGNDREANKTVSSVTMSSVYDPVTEKVPGFRWWMRGTVSKSVAESIVQLLIDLASGQISEPWAVVTKAAIADIVVSLTKIDEQERSSVACLKKSQLWLALAALCLLQDEHVEKLSSAQWTRQNGSATRLMCTNHDDGVTGAQLICADCGPLCAECDRVLHLHRRNRHHQRQVCKEEEEAIRVDVHEGCGRVKLFWLLALSDARGLKSLVEFRHRGSGALIPAQATAAASCRFCGAPALPALFGVSNVCSSPECQEYGKAACSRILQCGHLCGGVAEEAQCLPCLQGCSREASLKQDADDMCMVCFTEALSAAPAIQLKCGHVFHAHCCQAVLLRKWPGPRITFGFSTCPICKTSMDHSHLSALLTPIRELYEDVRRKALMRLEYEGLHQAEAITTPGGKFFNDAAAFAMDRYAYYVCYKCNKAYYGGEARCEADAAAGPGGDTFDPAELVCGGCSDVSRAQMCPRHGSDFLEYKCRYCCSVAVFFCFGTTHFCNPCHDDFRQLTKLPQSALPTCPAGPRGQQLEGDECPLHVKHPPTGEEFALGCGICRNAHTF